MPMSKDIICYRYRYRYKICLAGAVANVSDSDCCCNPKVPGSIPTGDKDFPLARKFNHISLCLGGHIKVRVPGATIVRNNTSCNNAP